MNTKPHTHKILRIQDSGLYHLYTFTEGEKQSPPYQVMDKKEVDAFLATE